MIDEDHLTQLLRAGAESYEAPEDGPRAVVRLAEQSEPPSPRRPWWRRPVVPVTAGILVVAVVAAVVTASDNRGASDMTAGPSPERSTPNSGFGGRDESAASRGDALSSSQASRGNASSSAQSSATNYGNTGDASSSATGGNVGSAGDAASSPRVSAGDSGSAGDAASTIGGRTTSASRQFGAEAPNAKVVKTGSMELEVPKGRVSATLSRLSALAVGTNGYIADSRTFETADTPSGMLTLRVPVATYEGVVEEVRRLGKVVSVTSQGRDVTDQHTDLQARIRALDATRAQYLSLLGRAESIQDILAVQTQVNQVQMQLEQLQGQLNALDDQATFASLAVAFAEPGDRVREEPRSGMGEAWDRAVDGFVGGIEAIVAHSGAVVVWLLALAALAIGIRGAWILARRRRAWARPGGAPPSE